MLSRAVICGLSAQSYNFADSPKSRYLDAQLTKIPGIAAEANPLVYASSATPQLLRQHGSADCTVAPLRSQILADRVDAAALGRAVLRFAKTPPTPTALSIQLPISRL